MYTEQAILYQNHFRNLIKFKGLKTELPPTKFQVMPILNRKKHLLLLHSHQCESYVNLRIKCEKAMSQLRLELRIHDELDIKQKEWDALDKTPGTQTFGAISGSIGQWGQIIVGGIFLGGICADLAETGISALRAGWVPLSWVGDFPNGYLTIFPVPGRSAPVPSEWIISAREAKQFTPNLKKAIPRSSFPTPRIPLASKNAWKTMVDLPPKKAATEALAPLILGAGKIGDQLIKKMSAQAISVKITGSQSKPLLELTFRTHSDDAIILTCSPPWTDSVANLPTEVAQIIRHYNGLTLHAGAPYPRWHRYRGPSSGFDFDWSPWEINDRETEPSAWKRKPLAPFTNGSDLWVYHPARQLGNYLELVKIDHESDTWEAEPQQHPGVRFLQMVHDILEIL